MLDFVTRELLTPNGVRTLSPKSFGYNPFFVGNKVQRQLALFNGPTRPWMTGFYTDAYLKVFGHSGVAFLRRMLIGHGAISFAPSIGGVLRALATLNSFDV